MSASESEKAGQESPIEVADSSDNHMEVDESSHESPAASQGSDSAPAEAKPEVDAVNASDEPSPVAVKAEESESGNKSPNPEENDNDDEKDVDEAANSDENDVEGEGNSDAPANAANMPEIDPIYQQTLLKPIFERREKSLKELLGAMDEFSPIIPDAVTDYYLTRAGFHSSDVRVKRLLALATQKFVADIANDAYQYSRVRAQSGGAPGGPGRSRTGPGSTSGRTVLTMESLSGVLEDYGVNAQRPDFFH